MSRHLLEVSAPAWRLALMSFAIVTGAVILIALLIALQSTSLSSALIFKQFDEHWLIRSGRVEADRLVLQPSANSIGLALHPIDSSTFTLQARVAFDAAQSSGGLIVQADDPDHFTAFLISGDGYFRVSDYRNGVWIDRAAWRAWPHIQRDGATNVLRAECGSDRCTFFVNDEWTWQEQRVPATHAIGVLANGTAEARFDQIGWQP